MCILWDILQGYFSGTLKNINKLPDSKVHGANMGPTLVLSAQDGPHVGPINEPCYLGSVKPMAK